jgi:hypothetical protein
MDGEKEPAPSERSNDKPIETNTGDDLPSRNPELVRQSEQPPKRGGAKGDNE